MRIRPGLPDDHGFVIAAAHRLASFGPPAWRPSEDIVAGETRTLEQHGHIGMLVVTEEAQGKGVGGALMRAAEAWAREHGYRRLTLNVFEANRTARAVYEHLGYAAETLRYVKIL
jgi:GNAT superfamily N-acetyltransferase